MIHDFVRLIFIITTKDKPKCHHCTANRTANITRPSYTGTKTGRYTRNKRRDYPLFISQCYQYTFGAKQSSFSKPFFCFFFYFFNIQDFSSSTLLRPVIHRTILKLYYFPILILNVVRPYCYFEGCGGYFKKGGNL